MRAVLIYPPLLDPTAGYHSLSYLKAYATSRGHRDVHIIDASVEAVSAVLDPADVRRRWERLHDQKLSTLDFLETAELLTLDLVKPDDVARAVAVLRDPDEFYHYPTYRWAVERIITWMGLVGLDGIPGQFASGFRLRTRGWSPARTADLRDQVLIARLNRPFEPYYREQLLPRLSAMRANVIGLNLTFIDQTPFALHMLRLMRERLPGVHLTVGGTEASDIWKYLRDRGDFFAVFTDADSAVLGEGETAFVSLLDHLDDPSQPLTPGVVVNPRHGPSVANGSIRFAHERTRDLPAPDFADLPFDRYLSPHRYAYLSPTRGCYWNRCTFCDYGLNDGSPTSPWRQDPVDKVFADLRSVAGSARFVYLSVDVLAPAMILQLAERIVGSGLDVRWGAEIRLERFWTPERCRLLYASGCRAVSMGFESGSQRILDLIDKGTRVDETARIIAAMAQAGIGVQMMGFTGFPTETLDEAMDSVRFLAERRREWTLGDLGEFVLTPGAIVARQPDRFRISEVAAPAGWDIQRSLRFDQERPLTTDERQMLARAKESLDVAHFGRPWVGGVDSPHSYFYHDRFGRGIVDVITGSLRQQAGRWSGAWQLNGVVVDCPRDWRLATDGGGRLAIRSTPDGEPTSFVVRADGRAFQLDRAHADLVRAVHELGLPSNPIGTALVDHHLVVPAASRRPGPPHVNRAR